MGGLYEKTETAGATAGAVAKVWCRGCNLRCWGWSPSSPSAGYGPAGTHSQCSATVSAVLSNPKCLRNNVTMQNLAACETAYNAGASKKETLCAYVLHDSSQSFRSEGIFLRSQTFGDIYTS